MFSAHRGRNMAVDEARRVRLYERLEHSIGQEATATLFEIIPAAGHQVATSADVAALGAALRADVEALGTGLRAEMAELRGELRAEMAELRGELRAEMAELRGELRNEMAELRGELRAEMAELRTGQHDQTAMLRKELNDALVHNTRMMLGGLVGTLLSAIGMAAVLSRLVG